MNNVSAISWPDEMIMMIQIFIQDTTDDEMFCALDDSNTFVCYQVNTYQEEVWLMIAV